MTITYQHILIVWDFHGESDYVFETPIYIGIYDYIVYIPKTYKRTEN